MENNFIKTNQKIEVSLSWFGKYGETKVKEVYYHKFDKEQKTPVVRFGKKWFTVYNGSLICRSL